MGAGVFGHQKDHSNVYQQFRNIRPIMWNQPWLNLRSAAGWWTIQWCGTGWLKSTEIKSQIWVCFRRALPKGLNWRSSNPCSWPATDQRLPTLRLQVRPSADSRSPSPKGQPRWFAWNCSPSGWGWRNTLTFATTEHKPKICSTNSTMIMIANALLALDFCSVARHEATRHEATRHSRFM